MPTPDQEETQRILNDVFGRNMRWGGAGGVEAETHACGTGAIAAGLGLSADSLPVRIRSRSGSVYSLSATIGPDRATDVWLCGEGRLVFSGRLTD